MKLTALLTFTSKLRVCDRTMYPGAVCTYVEFTAYATLYASAGT